jgi:hypothetical protein
VPTNQGINNPGDTFTGLKALQYVCHVYHHRFIEIVWIVIATLRLVVRSSENQRLFNALLVISYAVYMYANMKLYCHNVTEPGMLFVISVLSLRKHNEDPLNQRL